MQCRIIIKHSFISVRHGRKEDIQQQRWLLKMCINRNRMPRWWVKTSSTALKITWPYKAVRVTGLHAGTGCCCLSHGAHTLVFFVGNRTLSKSAWTHGQLAVWISWSLHWEVLGVAKWLPRWLGLEQLKQLVWSQWWKPQSEENRFCEETRHPQEVDCSLYIHSVPPAGSLLRCAIIILSVSNVA